MEESPESVFLNKLAQEMQWSRRNKVLHRLPKPQRQDKGAASGLTGSLQEYCP